MLALTALPSGSVVNIAPGSGCAEVVPALKAATTAISTSQTPAAAGRKSALSRWRPAGFT